jgi:hypothetical protein
MYYKLFIAYCAYTCFVSAAYYVYGDEYSECKFLHFKFFMCLVFPYVVVPVYVAKKLYAWSQQRGIQK